MDHGCKIQCYETILRAAIIAMDGLAPTASEYLLKEIPWAELSVDEILKMIKIVRNQSRDVPDSVLSMEVR